MPQGRRGWLSTWVWASVEATTLEAPTGRSPGLGGASSDSMEFQASQLGHLPNQPEVTIPQAWQTHRGAAFLALLIGSEGDPSPGAVQVGESGDQNLMPIWAWTVWAALASPLFSTGRPA